MFHHIQGKLTYLGPTRAVLEASGVGYELSIPLSTHRALVGEEEARLLTHFWVREDAQRLFGFSTEAERQVFRLVVTVNGVGPSIALAILGTFSAEEFSLIIERGDAEPLRRIKGVGKRLAERLLVELGDRLPSLSVLIDREQAGEAGASRLPAGPPALAEEAALALVELGFSRKDADQRIRGALDRLEELELEGAGLSVEQLLTQALRSG